MAASYMATPVLESLTSEYCKIFKSIYFEKHLQTTGTAASENVFIKLRKIKIYSSGVLTLHLKKGFFNFNINIQSYACFYFMIGFIFFYFQWRGFIFKWGSPMSIWWGWGGGGGGGSKKSCKEGVPAHAPYQGKPCTILKI